MTEGGQFKVMTRGVSCGSASDWSEFPVLGSDWLVPASCHRSLVTAVTGAEIPLISHQTPNTRTAIHNINPASALCINPYLTALFLYNRDIYIPCSDVCVCAHPMNPLNLSSSVKMYRAGELSS